MELKRESHIVVVHESPWCKFLWHPGKQTVEGILQVGLGKIPPGMRPCEKEYMTPHMSQPYTEVVRQQMMRYSADRGSTVASLVPMNAATPHVNALSCT